MPIWLNVTATGSAIEYGSQTITMSRYSETHARLIADYGIGTHDVDISDAPAYIMAWIGP